MKKLWWFLRILVVAIALCCILGFANGFIQQDTKADEGGQCDTSRNCAGEILCTCSSPDCTHCLIPSGSLGCGKCYKQTEGN
jgi:hypothetical protein